MASMRLPIALAFLIAAKSPSARASACDQSSRRHMFNTGLSSVHWPWAGHGARGDDSAIGEVLRRSLWRRRRVVLIAPWASPALSRPGAAWWKRRGRSRAPPRRREPRTVRGAPCSCFSCLFWGSPPCRCTDGFRRAGLSSKHYGPKL